MNLCLVLFLITSLALAQERAKVGILRGSATFNGKSLSPEQVLRGKGQFIVAEKSYLKLILEKSLTQIALGAGTTSEIDLDQKGRQPELRLLKGIGRWLTGARKIPGGGIKTSNATMGVRGTDFFVIYNPHLVETEIVCFEGSVQFTSDANIADSKIIRKNQWGGVGGRFGKNLSSTLNLKEELVNLFKNELPLE